MTRRDALIAVKVAGYHDDARTGTRLYVENRMSRSAFNEAWTNGARARRAGVKCSCFHCNKPATAAH